MPSRRRRRQPEFPELKDYFARKLHLYEIAEELGVSIEKLPSKYLGTLGGLTNKFFVALAEQDLADPSKFEDFKSCINQSARHTIDEFQSNPNKVLDINPVLKDVLKDYKAQEAISVDYKELDNK